MSSQPIECVLFDLDGTLVDSAPDLLVAVNRLLTDVSAAPLSLSVFRPIVSKGARAMLALAFPDLAPEKRERLVPSLLEHYAAAIADHSEAFDGIQSLLHRIERAGLRWGIVTNKPEGLARQVVHAMGWTDRCAIVIGGDTLAAKKPDPAQLLHACAALKTTPERSVYVGDDERDVQAARAAGMPSIIALWGYREAHDDPSKWGADRSIAHPLELCFELADGIGRDKY